MIIISEQNYITLGCEKLWYTKFFTQETQSAIPLVIVHGGPGLSHNYLLSLKEIASQRPVILYDQLGCGKSVYNNDGIDNIHFDYYVQELGMFVQALNMPTLHLLGHSWGGGIAAAYALHYPQTITSLVLASPWLGADQWTKNICKLAYALSPTIYNALAHHEATNTMNDAKYKKAVDILQQTYFSDVPWHPLLQQSMDTFNVPLYTKLWGPYETKITGTLATIDIMPKLVSLHIPTLITCGLYDCADVETMREIVNLIPNAKLVVFDKSKHFPHLSEQAKYLQTIENFFR